MAKLAIQNKDPMQASDWLIQSVKKNSNSLEQRQKAFELLGSIHYNMDQYAIAKIAYDSLTGVLKTNPNFETIVARKKWMLPISNNQIAMQLEDSLLYIYKQPEEVRKTLFDNWTKRMNTRASVLTQLFIADPKKEIAKVYINPLPENNFNKPLNDFYFQNKNSVANGKQQFVQKWGERPNVDQWRRKTSGTIAYANTSLTKTNTDIVITKDSTKKEQNSISATILAINDNQDLDNSLKKWNEAAIKNAQLFLLELNDFEKALPIYRKIIERDIDPIITERALLDLASQYIHDNQKEKSDAIIENVIKKYPNGFYVTKQREANTKKQLSTASLDNYKIAYFLSKIGKWDSLGKAHPLISQTVLKTKWNTPYQFIRVKMYAQQRKDSLAIIVLDSIILQNQNELNRERAKNIITELKNRKKTETYLSQLVNIIPVNTTVVEENNITPVEKELVKAEKPILSENQSQVIANKTGKTSIQFTNDSTEEHYMAMVIKGSKEVFVKEAQTALDNVNEDEFKKLQLDVTYVQFNQDTYIVWVGPFDRQQESIQYAQKIKPRLKTEIISFIPTKQYEIFIFGKSNILQINNDEDLLQYKDFMLKNIYK
jgi:tetratricopeptide (TPR) repeat protein